MLQYQRICRIYKKTFSFYCADGFGEKGRPASAEEGAVPVNAALHVDLELVSWKTVTEIGEDKKITKKILKEGEGYEKPNEGAVVKGTCIHYSAYSYFLNYCYGNCS
jgi:hypothetical protein